MMTRKQTRLPKHDSSCSICLPVAHSACRLILYLALGVNLCHL